jgi:hypothetical protein
MHSVDPFFTLVAVATPLLGTAPTAQSVSGNSSGAAAVYAGRESNFSVDNAGERVLHATLIRRSEEPRSAVEDILRLATTVNSSLESDQ